MILGMAVFLCACEPATLTNTEKTKLKVAVFQGAYHTSYWDYCAKAFEDRHPEVDVELSINTNIGNILLPRMKVQDVPDVVYLGSNNESGYTQKMIEDKKIASLESVFDQSIQEQFLPGLLDSKLLRPYEDQELYLAPLYYNVTGLWYHKELFERYGYELPSTWSEFLALGKQAKEDGVRLFTYQGLTPSYLEALLWPMLAEKVGMDGLHDLFEDKEGAWKQEGVLDVLNVFYTIAQEGYMSEDTITLTYTQAQKRFLKGEALFLPCGNWFTQEMAIDIEDEAAYGFMSVPTFDSTSERYATVMIEQLYVPKDAKHVELAKEFVAMQYEKEFVKQNQTMSGGFVPVIQDSYHQEEPFQIFEEALTPITTDFDLGNSNDLEKEIFEQLSKILAKEQTPEEMIEQLSK